MPQLVAQIKEAEFLGQIWGTGEQKNAKNDNKSQKAHFS
jgi:hypothetical protein